MELEPDYYELFVASLMHDVGKFFQRTGLKHDVSYNNLSPEDFGLNGAHSKWSASFIEKYWDNDVIVDYVLHHHNPSKSSNPTLCHMLTTADHHSASERVESDEKRSANSLPLISIFSNVSLNSQSVSGDYFHRLDKIDIDKSFDELIPKNNVKEVMSGYNLEFEYGKLWSEFNREFECLNNLDDIESIVSLLKKYTSFIPSAVYKSRSDISLYDHSKTTAALAICRYLYYKSEGKIFKTSDKESVYLVINGDLSGIQKFIFKVYSPQEAQKGMSKRLRGRSLYISLLVDAVVESIVSILGLNSTNILFSAGGRFTIIAPNTREVIDKINKINQSINEFFIKEFDGDLYLSLIHVEASGNDLSSFDELTDSLNAGLSDDKKHRFKNHLSEIFETEENVEYENLCVVCGNNTRGSICGNCSKHKNLGTAVSNAKYLIKCQGISDYSEFDLYFKELNIGYVFKKSESSVVDTVNLLVKTCEQVKVIKLNDTDFLGLVDKLNYDNVSFSFEFIGNTVPYHSTDDVLSFEQLAQLSTGISKLGILKMDVDNLGLIFSEGLNNYTISKVSTLSSYLDMFFLGFINTIAEEYKVYESDSEDAQIKIKSKDENEYLYFTRDDNGAKALPTIYIDYSGGDDLLVIGPYDDIINFSINLRNKFRLWTCNNDSITLSAGIQLISPKFPIGKAIELCENNLEMSKKSGKDKITLFNEVLSWDSNGYFKGFEDLVEYGKELEKYTLDRKISKSMSYSFLKLWQTHYKFELNNVSENQWNNNCASRLRCKSYIPYFKYKIRLINDKQIRDRIDETGIQYMPWIKIPVSWVSLRTR